MCSELIFILHIRKSSVEPLDSALECSNIMVCEGTSSCLGKFIHLFNEPQLALRS